jgi:predicted dehydrogenase
MNPFQRVLVEKPLVTDLRDIQALFEEAKPKTLSVFCYAGYIPDVEQAAKLLPDFIQKPREVQSYISFFSDPYEHHR